MKISTTLMYLCLLFVCLASSFESHAHDGLHDTTTTYNTWQLANGQIIQGNFLWGNHQCIVLAQMHGQKQSIAIDQLSHQDQQLARFKVKKIATYQQAEAATVLPKSNRQAYSMVAFLFLLALACCMYYCRKNITLQVRPMIYGVLACFVFMAFSKRFLSIPKADPTSIAAAFAAYKPQVQTSWNKEQFFIASNGLATHEMMKGITSWQQQVPLPQNYTGNNQWQIPLQPQIANHPLSTKNNFMRGAVAIAVNGVPIFNALNNRGEDAYLVGELDEWGGHCGRADDYHYHIAPLHLYQKASLPIAYALDGFAVYGQLEPNGQPMQPLDACNGHMDAMGNYHYHGTKTYPYVIGAMKGVVQIDATKPAPENQVVQPKAKPIRPPQNPLRGATITQCKPIGSNGYELSYTINHQTGTVAYQWDSTGQVIFKQTAINGQITTNTYQRKN